MKKNRLLLKGLKLFTILFVILFLHKETAYANSDEAEYSNPYFVVPEQGTIEYRGFFYPLSYREIWQNVKMHIEQIEDTGNGILYAMELDELNVRETLDRISYGEKYLGYFYVTKDAIYHMPEGVATPEGRRSRAEVVKMLQEDEEAFMGECTVVCSEKGTENKADENGYHEYVEVDGDRRIFHLYNDYAYGTKQYTRMVWEKGKGLVYYRMGSGGMIMHIELWQEDEEIYGGDFKRMEDMTVIRSHVRHRGLENADTYLSIFYPEIYGFGTPDKETAVNACIKKALEPFMEGDMAYVEMKYEVKVINSKFIVIFYSGKCQKKGEEQKYSIQMSVTVDVENEKTDIYTYN